MPEPKVSLRTVYHDFADAVSSGPMHSPSTLPTYDVIEAFIGWQLGRPGHVSNFAKICFLPPAVLSDYRLQITDWPHQSGAFSTVAALTDDIL
jgi:hypothetical protein